MNETLDPRVQALIDKNIKDRNMDPASISEHYSVQHFGMERDPDYFEPRSRVGWGYYSEAPAHLDHITRNMAISTMLAYMQRPGAFHQGKKAVMMGATYEQMLESYEFAFTGGGGMVLNNGLYALRRMYEEGVEPGQQATKWTNHWLDLGAGTPSKEREGAREETLFGQGLSKEELVARYAARYFPGDQFASLRRDIEFASRREPDYYERYAKLVWGIFEEKDNRLDPIRQQLGLLLILAFQGRTEQLYIHSKQVLDHGASIDVLLETFQVGFIGAGSRVLHEGIGVARRLYEEGYGRA